MKKRVEAMKTAVHVENTERSERYPPKTHLAGGGGTLVLVPAPQRQGGAPQQ